MEKEFGVIGRGISFVLFLVFFRMFSKSKSENGPITELFQWNAIECLVCSRLHTTRKEKHWSLLHLQHCKLKI